MRTTSELKPEGPHTRRLQTVQWLLPLGLFAVAAVYETLEHVVIEHTLPSWLAYASEVVFFGVLGPLCVAIALVYIRRLLKEQVLSRQELEEANRKLELTVAERTRHVEEARLKLEQKNRALSTANEELQRLDQMRSDFVALVSHSFRAPLTNFGGALELIAQDSASLPERVQDTLAILTTERIRLEYVVSTILDVSRLENGHLPMSMGPVAMEPLLRRVGNTAHPPQSQRQILVEVPHKLPPAWADEVCVEEILRNLVSNAEEYSPADSPVHLAARLVDDTLVVSVTDHGPGIPADTQARIFQAFQRSEVGERRDTSGLGLGLYFASKLVQAQGGSIWVESPVWSDSSGAGARFVFTLPVAADVPKLEEASWPEC